jgi:ubiquinone biosynthesis protein
MSLSLRPRSLKRYQDIAGLVMRYAGTDILKYPYVEQTFKLPEGLDSNGEPRAEAFARDLEQLGPTFVKLGQLLSTRSDVLPLSYIKALSRLQDKVEPFRHEEVERIINEELGVGISKAFAEFDKRPIAIGQAHRARLRDGRLVAVKVLRPNIKGIVSQDLESLHEIAEFLDRYTQFGDRYEFTKMFEEFRKGFVREFDYRQEARNLEILHGNLQEFDQLVVPLPIEEYTTSRISQWNTFADKKLPASARPLGQRLEAKCLRAGFSTRI